MGKKYAKVDKKIINHPAGAGKIAVWRVKALVDIPMHNIKAGQYGGFIDRSSHLSQFGNAFVGGQSYVLDGSAVSGDALVSDWAVISNTAVEDSAVVKGNARINSIPGAETLSRISEFAKVFDYARVSSSEISGYSKISGLAVLYQAEVDGESQICGLAKIHGPASIVDSKVYGEAIIHPDVSLDNAKVHCTAIIREDYHVENSEIFGNTVLKEDAYEEVIKSGTAMKEKSENPKCSMDGYEIDTCIGIVAWNKIPPRGISRVSTALIYSADKAKARLTTKASKVKETMDDSRFRDIEAEYAAYETDIVKIIKYPAMSDMTDQHTSKFNALLRAVRRAVKDQDSVVYKEKIDLLEEAYYVAESNARKLANSLFNECSSDLN